MLGIQHVIAPEIHSVSLCHHDVQPHIVEHRGDGGRGMEKNDGLVDQKVQYMLFHDVRDVLHEINTFKQMYILS